MIAPQRRELVASADRNARTDRVRELGRILLERAADRVDDGLSAGDNGAQLHTTEHRVGVDEQRDLAAERGVGIIEFAREALGKLSHDRIAHGSARFIALIMAPWRPRLNARVRSLAACASMTSSVPRT